MAETGYRHIELRDDGRPWIKDTQIKVLEIAQDIRGGWDGQEIHENYPWISLPQIYSALAYYFEHKDEIDADIERRERLGEELLDKLVDPEFMARAQTLKQQQRA